MGSSFSWDFSWAGGRVRGEGGGAVGLRAGEGGGVATAGLRVLDKSLGPDNGAAAGFGGEVGGAVVGAALAATGLGKDVGGAPAGAIMVAAGLVGVEGTDAVGGSAEAGG